jgi:ABC-type nickel/cobalt efflux system permease component RcnA
MNEALLLCWTAATIGTVHTLLGPDHYLPFIAMSRAGRWTLSRTLTVTVLCGLGHLVGSVVLGLIGIALGTAVFKVEGIEAARGDIAAWMMIAFGSTYLGWALVRMARNRPHAHWHSHDGGPPHFHEHVHQGEHLHAHEAEHAATAKTSMTPWVLFTIFFFGPCEPLIPLLMYPAAQGHWGLLILVTSIFAITTVATMTIVVWVVSRGVTLGFRFPGRFAEPLAGFVVLACGVAIKAGL